ncbi:phosphate ABC transporter substrate-binding protein, partial [Mesorhizobium sp. USDA-HM6]
LYSSALVMFSEGGPSVASPANGKAVVPLDLIRGKRFTFNNPDSMSGLLALTRDLEAMGEGLDIFGSRSESGGHRSSIVAVAEGRADIAAIDCQSWALAQRYEPAARRVKVVGWTARRKGLPFITGRTTPASTVSAMREAIAVLGLDGSVAQQPLVERVG